MYTQIFFVTPCEASTSHRRSPPTQGSESSERKVPPPSFHGGRDFLSRSLAGGLAEGFLRSLQSLRGRL